MSFRIIKGFINLKRITPSRVYQLEGKEGDYLKIVCIQKQKPDSYGNIAYSVKEDVSKEERESGTEGSFLGEISEKIIDRPDGGPQGNPPPPKAGGYPRKW